MNPLRNLRSIHASDVLHKFGLQRRSTTAAKAVGALGFIGIGVLLGSVVGMLFAPKSGTKLRADLRQRIGSLSDGVSGWLPSARANGSRTGTYASGTTSLPPNA